MARIFPAVLVLVSTAVAAWGTQPAGIWKMSANAPDGKTYQATLAVMEQGSTLSASIASPSLGVIPVENVVSNGDDLSFRFRHEKAGFLTFKLHRDGSALKGTMETQDGERGTIAAARAESDSPSLAGTWTLLGKQSDGSPTKVILELAQSGNKVSGGITTQNGDKAEIASGVAGDGIVYFKLLTDDGAYDIAGELTGAELRGIYRSPNGGRGTFSGTRR